MSVFIQRSWKQLLSLVHLASYNVACITRMTVLPIDRIDKVSASLVARVPTPEGAIFFCLSEGLDGSFEAFYRKQYNEQTLARCTIDPKSWTISRDAGAVCPGEDPRTFAHRGVRYVVDNSWGQSSLIVPDEDFRSCRLPSKGKNLTLIPHGDALLCIEWLRPLTVLTTSESPYPETWHRLKRKASDERDTSLRGGTPGYRTPTEGIYIGFGHRTVQDASGVTHEPFAWRLDTVSWSLSTAAVDATFERRITDPTCVIQHEGKFFLVTPESHHPWFGGMQEFYTCVYQLHFDGQ